MKQGAIEESIIQQAIKFNVPIPQTMEESPQLLPGLDLYYIAFSELGSSRQTGFGLGPIPWTATQAYCQAMELDEDQTEAMHFHIPRMDLVYLKHMSKKNANSQVLSQHSQKGQAV